MVVWNVGVSLCSVNKREINEKCGIFRIIELLIIVIVDIESKERANRRVQDNGH